MKSILLALLSCSAVIAVFACDAAAPTRAVNPPEFVSVELLPYVGRFEESLYKNGLSIATEQAPENFDLRLTYSTSTASITVTAELLLDGRAVVTTPIKNRTFFKNSEISDTTVLAASRFMTDVSKYLVGIGYQTVADTNVATSTTYPEEVKVYYRPPQSPYDEVGILQASSSNSWTFSSQGKMNKVIERLKAQAAKMGANGVLLIGLGTEYGGSVNTANTTVTGVGNTAYGSGLGTSVPIVHKAGTAVAIYVHPNPAATDVATTQGRSEAHQASESVEAHNADDRVDGVYESILKLDDLRQRGLLTDEEFEAEKRKLLSGD